MLRASEPHAPPLLEVLQATKEKLGDHPVLSHLSHKNDKGKFELNERVIELMGKALEKQGVDTSKLVLLDDAGANSENLIYNVTSQPGILVKIVPPHAKGIFSAKVPIHHPRIGPGRELKFPSSLGDEKLMLRIEKKLLTGKDIFGYKTFANHPWVQIRSDIAGEMAKEFEETGFGIPDLGSHKPDNIGFWPKGVSFALSVDELKDQKRIPKPETLDALKIMYDVYVLDPGAIKLRDNKLPENYPQKYWKPDPRFNEIMSAYRANKSAMSIA